MAWVRCCQLCLMSTAYYIVVQKIIPRESVRVHKCRGRKQKRQSHRENENQMVQNESNVGIRERVY